MALRVWLPLNGSLKNQGLSNLTITNIGATADTSGKLGSCYSFDGTNDRIAFSTVSWTYPLSICGWFYPTNVDGTATQYFISYNLNNSGSSGHAIGVGTLNNGKSLAIWVGGSCYTVGTTLINNEWYHLTVTIDENNNYNFYLNGELKKTGTGNANPGSNWITIGARSNSTYGSISSAAYYFNGKANDIRIYDECLSQKQVKEISKGLFAHYKLDDSYIEATENVGGTISSCYNATKGTYGFGTNTDIYKTTVENSGPNKHSAAIKMYMGTADTTANPYPFFDNLTPANNTSKTLSFDYYPTICNTIYFYDYRNQTTFTYHCNGNTGTGSNVTIPVTLNKWNHIELIMTRGEATYSGQGCGYMAIGSHTTTLTDYWMFANIQVEVNDHETPYTKTSRTAKTTITDVSGFQYDSQIEGSLSTSTETARYSKSIVFPGSAVKYLYRSKFDWLKSPYTFNCWVYQTSATTTSSGSSSTLQFIMSQGRDCGYAGFSLASSNGHARLYIGTATSGTYYTIHDSTTSLLNAWHMLTGTFDGTTAKLYVDGTLIGSQSISEEASWDQATGFVIGKMSYLYTSTTSYFPFVGNISDVRAYATALSADDIKILYQDSAIIDNKGNSYAYEFVEGE